MDNYTFTLDGSYEQRIMLVSAVRYAWGRHTYMPSSTCEILEKHIDQLDPYTAFVIARDIRNYWVKAYGGLFEGRERGIWYDSAVRPFVDLLPLLDDVSRPILEMDPYMDAPQPPVGYNSWDDVPDEVRYRWPTS